MKESRLTKGICTLILFIILMITYYNTFVSDPIPVYIDRTTNTTIRLIYDVCISITFYNTKDVNIYLYNHNELISYCSNVNICNLYHIIDNYDIDNYTAADYKIIFANKNNKYPSLYEDRYLYIPRLNYGCKEEYYRFYIMMLESNI